MWLTPTAAKWVRDMCFHRSRYRDERAQEERGQRLWDLFYRETERNEPPVPIAEQEEDRSAERDRDEVPAGVKR